MTWCLQHVNDCYNGLFVSPFFRELSLRFSSCAETVATFRKVEWLTVKNMPLSFLRDLWQATLS